MVSHMDDAVRRVLRTLDETGVRGNTLVLFMSDNGGQRDWQQTRYGGKHGPYARLGDNRPLRGWKGDLYEGGVRVVGLVNWRGRLEPRTVREVVTACDFYPTIAGLTGPAPPASPRLDGIDVWQALTGAGPLPPRTFYWNVGSHAGILHGGHKLIRRVRGSPAAGEKPVQLFDLAADPLEQREVSAAMPARVAELQAMLDRELETAAAEASVRPGAGLTPR
jgi:arylsulfatase A-like enzyme